jgi:hypothetical protein
MKWQQGREKSKEGNIDRKINVKKDEGRKEHRRKQKRLKKIYKRNMYVCMYNHTAKT